MPQMLLQWGTHLAGVYVADLELSAKVNLVCMLL